MYGKFISDQSRRKKQKQNTFCRSNLIVWWTFQFKTAQEISLPAFFRFVSSNFIFHMVRLDFFFVFGWKDSWIERRLNSRFCVSFEPGILEKQQRKKSSRLRPITSGPAHPSVVVSMVIDSNNERLSHHPLHLNNEEVQISSLSFSLSLNSTLNFNFPPKPKSNSLRHSFGF